MKAKAKATATGGEPRSIHLRVTRDELDALLTLDDSRPDHADGMARLRAVVGAETADLIEALQGGRGRDLVVILVVVEGGQNPQPRR